MWFSSARLTKIWKEILGVDFFWRFYVQWLRQEQKQLCWSAMNWTRLVQILEDVQEYWRYSFNFESMLYRYVLVIFCFNTIHVYYIYIYTYIFIYCFSIYIYLHIYIVSNVDLLKWTGWTSGCWVPNWPRRPSPKRVPSQRCPWAPQRCLMGTCGGLVEFFESNKNIYILYSLYLWSNICRNNNCYIMMSYIYISPIYSFPKCSFGHRLFTHLKKQSWPKIVSRF